jgi:CubicO group peptidase (beta-lactamase class C family)
MEKIMFLKYIYLTLYLFILYPVYTVCANNLNHDVSSNTFIQNWMIAGPFSLPGQNYESSFSHDFLISLGGEANANLNNITKISYSVIDAGEISVDVMMAKTDSKGILNFEKYYPEIDYNVVYAYTTIFSDIEQDVYFLLGSDDGVKVWINGELSFSNDAARGLTPGEDRFYAHLMEGSNTLLVKVTDYIREWALIVEVYDSSGFSEILVKEKEKAEFREFLDCNLEVVPNIESEISFYPGNFPELRWNKPYLVQKIAGDMKLDIRWYDKDLNEVSYPDEPGRYAYYAEGESEKGFKIRRAATLYCFPYDWLGWSERPQAFLDYIPISSIDKSVWITGKDAIAPFVGRMFYQSALNQTDMAILISFLDEQKDAGSFGDKANTPIIRNQDYHAALKQKILGSEDKWAALIPPTVKSGRNATVLSFGNEQEAGFRKGTGNSIKKLCEEWFTESGEPFDILVARNGIVILNEAFGENDYGKFATDTPTEIASITKLLTGLMFGRFVDQGIIAIDDPVGKFLPDFPLSGSKALTMRHLFTHTSGLEGHGTWNGIHNPWLDNFIATLIPQLPIGEIYLYNGNGYNLSGKVMEIASGKSILRLMRENLFDPLEMKNTILDEDLAYGCNSTAFDMAKIGQLLLNKGSYGELEFFSTQTFEKLLPEPLNKYYPVINEEKGIGITWMRYQRPATGEEKDDEDSIILSKNIIGHGSATSAVLMADLDNGIVITQSRRNGGKYFDEYLTKLLLMIEENLLFE